MGNSELWIWHYVMFTIIIKLTNALDLQYIREYSLMMLCNLGEGLNTCVTMFIKAPVKLHLSLTEEEVSM